MTSPAPQNAKPLHACVPVDLGERSYDILIGPGLLQSAGEHIAPRLNQPRTLVVTDSTVANIHLETLLNSLRASGIETSSYVVPAGEASKSFTELEKLCEAILTARLERADSIIALGGGVIGDLTGFAAAIVRRGMKFIQIPTTLLSQVDSSVGGKTGINTTMGKNLVGAFHQPSLVLADIACLDTLPARDFLSGYAEVVKYGLINDPDFFSWLDLNLDLLKAGDIDARAEAVRRSCLAKANIVAQDETEQGLRALLNLGHTFGHALEAETGYSARLTHGEGVAIGMALAMAFSAEEGLCPSQESERATAHLARAGLKTQIKQIEGPALDPDRLLTAMFQDKKVQSGRLTFILSRGIGQAYIARDIAPEKLKAFLTTQV
ncbi:MAG: 3-dehydroquinate synthase [Alphaproteobacteria bacterium]|nr:MAG: 3-dehydroquinate synthase [Alphaproteobacteria bacterium]